MREKMGVEKEFPEKLDDMDEHVPHQVFPTKDKRKLWKLRMRPDDDDEPQ